MKLFNLASAKRDPRTAAELKAIGVQKGWPDILLIAPGGRLHALELKRRGEDMTMEQQAFAACCQERGFRLPARMPNSPPPSDGPSSIC